MLKLFIGIICVIFISSCGTSKRMENIRAKQGNDLIFAYFKKTDLSSAQYSTLFLQKFPYNSDSVTINYFGGMSEVSNKQYWKFLSHLEHTDKERYYKHKPETANWKVFKNKYSDFADSMSQNYDDLSLFGDYPVVNITPDNAIEFVNWLNSIEPDSTIFYSLFTESDWLNLFNDTPKIDSSFSWRGNYWRNESDKQLGNYSEFNQNQIRHNQLTDEIEWAGVDSLGYEAFYNGPLPVFTYNPNNWGAWNMSGNVAEITDNYYKKGSVWYCTTHGGSWGSSVFYLRKSPTETYQLPSPYVGFRVLKLQVLGKNDVP